MTGAVNYLKAFSFPLMVYIVLLMVIVYDNFFQHHHFILEAVSIDLIVTVPLVYFVAARRYKTSSTLAFLLMSLGLVLAYMLPGNHDVPRLFSTLVLPAVEAIVLMYLVIKFFSYAKRMNDHDAYVTIKKSAVHIFGDGFLSRIFATEFAIVWYALICWRRKQADGFTCYRDNNCLVMYGFLLFIVFAETMILHFAIVRNYPAVAWILTGTSIYFALQILAHAKAIFFRFSSISTEQLTIHYGLVADTVIKLDQINDIHITSNFKSNNATNTVRFGLLKSLEPYSVAIELITPTTIYSFYGFKKIADTLLVPVDNAKEFVRQVKEHISHLHQ